MAAVAHPDWNRCAPWIERAIARDGLYTITAVADLIESGAMQFWPGPRCAAVTEIVPYPKGKALNIFAGAGEAGQSLAEMTGDLEPCLQSWAKAAGCRWIMAYGRRGWERVAAPMGYRHLWSVMAKEISP